MISFPFSKSQFTIAPVTSDDSEALHEIHRKSFYHAWDEETFTSFLTDPQMFGFTVSVMGKPEKILGFILCRLVIDAVFRYLYQERAKQLFLEVDETNKAALALYKSSGFNEVGRRPGYYQTGKGHSDALIMRRTIQQND